MQLNEEQLNAKKFIVNSILDKNIKNVLLIGNAGTGKTFTLVRIVEELIKKKLSVGIACPTHKSKTVLEQMFHNNKVRANVETIHHMLGLIVVEEKGEVFLQQEWDGTINDFDVVVLDECSMIDDDLFEIIEDSGIKFIFVGDDAQLPPVSKNEDFENKSKTFEVDTSIRLLNIIRQNKGNPIIELSQKLRNPNKRIPVFQETLVENKGIFILSNSEWENSLLKEFETQSYQDNINYCKALAYRNRRVDELNKKIHDYLYPDCKTLFNVGERVVLNSPVTRKVKKNRRYVNEVVHSSGKEGQVVAVNEAVGKADLNYWVVSVLFQHTVYNGYLPVNFRMYEQVLNGLLEEAKEDKRKWKNYYDLKNYLFDIKFCYASTVHKSQGSTYQNVYIDKEDIMTCNNCRIKHNVLYTALTRSNDNCYILQ